MLIAIVVLLAVIAATLLFGAHVVLVAAGAALALLVVAGLVSLTLEYPAPVFTVLLVIIVGGLAYWDTHQPPPDQALGWVNSALSVPVR